MNTDQESKIHNQEGGLMTVKEAEEVLERVENSSGGAYIRFDSDDEVLIDGHIPHYALKALLVIMEDKIKKAEGNDNG